MKPAGNSTQRSTSSTLKRGHEWTIHKLPLERPLVCPEDIILLRPSDGNNCPFNEFNDRVVGYKRNGETSKEEAATAQSKLSWYPSPVYLHGF